MAVRTVYYNGFSQGNAYITLHTSREAIWSGYSNINTSIVMSETGLGLGRRNTRVVLQRRIGDNWTHVDERSGFVNTFSPMHRTFTNVDSTRPLRVIFMIYGWDANNPDQFAFYYLSV